MEPTRHEILRQVVANVKQHVCDVLPQRCLTVFDNASSEQGVVPELRDAFDNVYVANTNVGYWTAIAWWLEHIKERDVDYTYIIESDMVHYAFEKMLPCVRFLDRHDAYSAIRLHQWSYAERHLYDKSNPVATSKRNCWQSYINYKTKKRITFFDVDATDDSDVKLYGSHFLTQLPALNRYNIMYQAFVTLAQMRNFVEPDFQCLYYDMTQGNPVLILDGGMFQHDLGSYHAKTVTGSWSDPSALTKIGYQNTRIASIVNSEQYTVTRA